ncbi:MAG: glycoside hydrolase family 13 protein [Saprospiraceae bacterium]
MKKQAPTLLLFTLFFSVLCAQSVDKVEPPNWWTGMKETHLQLMVYGKEIGSLKPSTIYNGVIITGSHCPQNKNYLFIDLELRPETKSGIIPIYLSEGSKQILTIQYPILKRETESATRVGFNTSDVIYLLMPDRFANGIASNDNVDGQKETANRYDALGRHGGDIEGLSQHLDYFSELGITTLWLNPVQENNMPRHSYHGYAITDFYKVDPRLGTNESYRNFCKQSTTKGIKVIMDMVANHCGLYHPWLSSPPHNEWINYYNEPYTETNHGKYIITDPYASTEDKEKLTNGWFVKTMPDLNTRDPFLANYLIQNAIWWIEYAGLAGIRMDTYLYPDELFMSEWARRIMEEFPNINLAGEVWHNNPAVVSYWQKGKINPNGYVSHLPAVFDFPLQDGLKSALMGDNGWMDLYEVLAQDFQYPDPQNLVVFADNHDMSRVFTQVEEDYTKYQMALTYVLTTRGIPQLFYGTEILMTNQGTDNHGIIRSDFPGGWKRDSINAFTGEGLSLQQKTAYAFLQKLLLWRKGETTIHAGKTMHFVPKDGVYVLFRYDHQKRLMIVLNKNQKPFAMKLDRFQSILRGASNGFEIISGKKINLGSELQLNAAGPMIIEIDGGK